MTSPYATYFSVSSDGEVGTGWRNCKAGADGRCKHIAAACYFFLCSLQHQNVADGPPGPSPTDVAVYWQAHTSVPKSAPLHFEATVIVKHKPIRIGAVDTDAAEVLNPAHTSLAEHYKPFDGPRDQLFTSRDLRNLATELAATGDGSMVVDAIVSNNFQPVHDPATTVTVNHPYGSHSCAAPGIVHHDGPRVTLSTTLSPATSLTMTGHTAAMMLQSLLFP